MSHPVPILMYHKVGQPVTSKRDTFLNIAPQDFRRQMRVLARFGYQARTFAEVVEAFSTGRALPRKTFAITFDDGYQCIGDVAAPILAEFKFPATIFAVSQQVGKTNVWDRETGRPELPILDWQALRQLVSAGWEVAGHTRTHPHLDKLDDAAALAEIASGKEETEAELGNALTTFCYPFGHFNDRTPALVRNAGFLGACTTKSGIAVPGDDLYTLARVKVAYRDRVAGMLYRLWIRPHLP